MTTQTLRQMLAQEGQHILDKYLLGGYVCAIRVPIEEAETCLYGELAQPEVMIEGRIKEGEHIFVKSVGLKDEIPEGVFPLVITEATWKRSMTENLLKNQMEELRENQKSERK